MTRDAESLYFCGTLTPALKNMDSDSEPKIRHRIQDLLCDIVIVYLGMT